MFTFVRNQCSPSPEYAQIDATDMQIDKLVYELYGLTADEITIVEGSAK